MNIFVAMKGLSERNRIINPECLNWYGVKRYLSKVDDDKLSTLVVSLELILAIKELLVTWQIPPNA
jgi:hypothetical protein